MRYGTSGMSVLPVKWAIAKDLRHPDPASGKSAAELQPRLGIPGPMSWEGEPAGVSAERRLLRDRKGFGAKGGATDSRWNGGTLAPDGLEAGREIAIATVA